VHSCLYAALRLVFIAIKMIFGRGLCIDFLFLRQGFYVFDSCADFSLSHEGARDEINYYAGKFFSITVLKLSTKDIASSTHGFASLSLKTKKSS